MFWQSLLSVCFISLYLLLIPGSSSVFPQQPTVKQWDTFEITLTSNGTYANPYLEVEVTALFSGPGGIEKTVKGFWDGGSTYKVRFTPTATGLWNYVISSNPPDAGLSQNSSITAEPSGNNRGFVRVDNQYPSKLVYDNGEYYFMFGTTAYEYINNASNDFDNWKNTVDFYADLGINKVRLYVYPTDYRLYDDLSVRDQAESNGMKYADTQPFTLTGGTPNRDSLNIAHWQTLDQMIQYMAQQGMVADLILLNDPRYKVSYATTDPNIPAPQDLRYIRYILSRYAAYPNVIWCVVNEYMLITSEPYGLDKPTADTWNPFWNTIGNIVRNEDPWIEDSGKLRLLSIHGHNEELFPDETGRFPYDVPYFDFRFIGEPWPTFSSSEYGGYNVDDYTAPDWAGQRSVIKAIELYNIPSINDESGYYGMTYSWLPGNPGWNPDTGRLYMWSLYSAGGYYAIGEGYTPGGRSPIDGNVSERNFGYFGWSSGDYYYDGDMKKAYDEIKILIDFFTANGVEYWKMTSHNELVPGYSSFNRVYTLADPGSEYVVYDADGGSFNISLESGKTYNATRLNPRNGIEQDICSVPGGLQQFSSPSGSDWVYRIVDSQQPPQVCTLTNAYWSPAAATGGEPVQLIIEGSNCEGEELMLEVIEDDLFGGNNNLIIQPQNTTFTGNTATGTWLTEYYPDGASGNPEYYFSATLLSDTNTSINSLINSLLTISEDIEAPAIPQTFQAAVISSTHIGLSWDASTDNVAVAGYNIFRDSVQVSTTASTSYIDSGLVPDTAYVYTVTAYDNAGNESLQSLSDSAVTKSLPDSTSIDYYCNNDNDGFFDSTVTGTCTGGGCEPAGCRLWPGADCDDSNQLINPDASEVWYDGNDQDCDGVNDYDQDMDGYVDSNWSGQAGGTAPMTGDCSDTNPSVNPGASDIAYDGIDQDCSGSDFRDTDYDGFDATLVCSSDCNDSDPLVNPGAAEVWYDGEDRDCDGRNDYDQDMDGYVDSSWNSQAGGTAPLTGDCNDTDSGINPGMTDMWYDGIDHNCDGKNDYDRDMDGYVDSSWNNQAGGTAPLANDCDDTSPSIYPGASEIPYDGTDQDCSGTDLTDTDSDGYDSDSSAGYTGLQFSSNVAPVSTGTFRIDFHPVVKQAPAGQLIVRLVQDGNTFYELSGSDGGAHFFIRKVVNGVEKEVAESQSNYIQNINYRIMISFSPGLTVAEAFGKVLVLDEESTAVTVNSFEVESIQQDAYYDNIAFNSEFNPPYIISLSEPDGNNDTLISGYPYHVSYALTDPGNVITGTFYYDTDNTGFDGTLIPGECSSAPEGTGTCAWDTTGVAEGNYYIYGIADNGSSQISAYSEGQVTLGQVSFSDLFDTDTTGNYSLSHVLSVRGDGQLIYDDTGKRSQVLTGDDIALQFSNALPPGSRGSFSIDFYPMVKHPLGGEFTLRLVQDDNNYYELHNTDGYGPGWVRKVVNGFEEDLSYLQKEYSQNTDYRVFFSFSPQMTSVSAFGDLITINNDANSITVNAFELTATQQDAYFDNILYSGTSAPQNSEPVLVIGKPGISGDNVVEGTPFTITYTLDDPDDIVTAAFYYDSDNSGFDGTPIAGSCSASPEGAGMTCVWDTTGIAPADYYIHSTVNDSINPQVSVYSSGPLTINPVNSPELTISAPDSSGYTTVTGTPFTITYTLDDPDDIVTAAFYYDSDNTGFDGTPIAGSCSASPEGAGMTCAWDTTGVMPGIYYIYGTADDGTAQVSAYSDGPVILQTAPDLFSDDFSLDTTGNYTVTDTVVIGGTGSFIYDSVNLSVQVITGGNDCNDSDSGINPGAAEIPYDGIDQDCSQADLTDVDNDGYNAVLAGGSDCDDTNGSINPGAAEVADDGIDQDCNGADTITCIVDADQDGYGTDTGAVTLAGDGTCDTGQSESATANDCDDGNASINPAVVEICDGTDNNCNALVDDADPGITGQTTWFQDSDSDTYGNPSVFQLQCAQPAGHVLNNTDCNDGDININPAAADTCDGIDNDCNISTADGSAEAPPLNTLQDGVCNGSQRSCSTGAWADDYSGVNNYEVDEVTCDTLDNDCDSQADEGLTTSYFQDSDTDTFGNPTVSLLECAQPAGHVLDNTDCDDSDPQEYPGQTWFADSDSDAFGDPLSSNACERLAASDVLDNTDCDDSEAAINPYTYWFRDNDGDGFGDYSVTIQQCLQPAGPPDFVLNDLDYDDFDPVMGPPVRINSITPLYYSTLQEAYNMSENGDIIQCVDITFAEDLSISIDKTVTLDGGYNGAFSSSAGTSSLQGNIDISTGTLIIEDFTLE